MKLFVTVLVVTALVTLTSVSPSFASGRFHRLSHRVHHLEKQNRHQRQQIHSLRHDQQATFITLGCWLVKLYSLTGNPFTGGGNEDDWCGSFLAAPDPDPPPGS